MGKTAASIKLIQVLSSRNDYASTDELADILETNPRNIKEYIKEIEECGFIVESKNGIYGGYRLDKSSLLPSVKLTLEERKTIKEAIDFLSNKSDYLNKDEALKAFGKILANFESQNIVTPISMIDRFPLKMSKDELQHRYGILVDAIETQTKIEIEYLSSKGSVNTHTIHPYKMFLYNGGWFVLGFNETVGSVGYFKLNRINSLYKTRSHFTILKTFDEKDYLDDFGMKKNGDYYYIELEFEGLETALSERIYGKNQKITEIDSNHIKFSCEMQNKDMILSFVLSFGNKCKVLSPDWLRDMVKENLWNNLNQYE